MVCGAVEDGKGSETSMKGFAKKASMSDDLTRGRWGQDNGSKSFLSKRL